MAINTKTYGQFLSDQVSSLAASLGIKPNLLPGNVILAILQAVSLAGEDFLQSQGLQIYQAALGSTAQGPDLDSWMAQYGMKRKGAVQADGEVTVSLSSVSSANVYISPGIIVQTIGGGIQYQIIADTDQSGWVPSQNAYIIPAGYLTVNCTVQALIGGSASNVQAGQLAQIGSASQGISTVTNSAPILDGADAETDSAFLQRFILAFNSVNANSTITSIYSAALSVIGVVDVLVIENQDSEGDSVPASILVVVDDGSGNPSSILKDAVFTEVNAVRSGGIELTVIGPTLVEINVTCSIRIAAGASSGIVTGNVENAILDLVNTLGVGAELYSSQVYQVISNIPGVVAVEPSSLVIVQHGTSTPVNDVVPNNKTVYRTNNTNVSIGTY